MVIPDHRHVVSLGLFHTEVVADYGATDGLTLSARLPYDNKAQRVRYTTLDGQPYSPPYGDIHHRTETLRGLSDGQISATFPLLSELQASAGVSLPIGRTVPNPIVLGREGLPHEHIQFGTGTFDPVLALVWSHPLSSAGGLILTASADAQIPLYRNSRGFHAPVSIHWSAGPNVAIAAASLSLQFAGQYQSIGRWNGEADEGSGFQNGGVFLRASLPSWNGIRISPGVYREVYSRSLSDQTFRQGTTYSLTLTRAF